jgi:hypothetical protein
LTMTFLLLAILGLLILREIFIRLLSGPRR